MPSKPGKVIRVDYVCKLNKLIGKRFAFITLPLKIRGGTGSPLRVVAVLDASSPLKSYNKEIHSGLSRFGVLHSGILKAASL